MKKTILLSLLLTALTLTACTLGTNDAGTTPAQSSDSPTVTTATLLPMPPESIPLPEITSTIPVTTPPINPETTAVIPGTTPAIPMETTTELPATTAKPVTTTTKPVTTTTKPVTTTTKPVMTTTKPVTTTTKPVTTTTKPVTTSTKPVTTTTKPITTAPETPKFPATLSWNTLYPVRNDGHVTMLSSSAGGFANETAEKLFDSDLSTKLCTGTSGYTIVWKLDKAMPIGGYSLSTANDTANYDRRPASWLLEASLDGQNWITVSDISSGGLGRQNFTEYFFPLSIPGDYQYFRFTLRSPTGQTQMAEITLYARDLPKTPAMELADQEGFASSTYATAGMELVKRSIKDYYVRASHTVHDQPGSGTAFVWGAASFLEAVAEAYRTNPTDGEIYRIYVDLLDHAMTAYKVNGKITTPTGTYTVSYYNASRGSAGDYYYDDDAWICLQYLNAYTLLGEEGYLRRAEEMLEFFWTGWDDVQGGGIYWDKSFSSKNTCADGPIAIAFLSAYEMTGKTEYLEKGKLIYEWCRDVMLQNNLYSDSINASTGSINAWKAAYNQGTMLGVGSLLYRITGESRYLTETRATYNATVSHMFRVSGSNVSMHGNPIFKAWCIGWLQRGFLLFESIDPNGTTKGTDYMAKVLDKTLATKNANGYYDPYFCTGDWGGESKTDVLQPSGVACTLLLVGLTQ